jgi:hypothetical protein
MWRLRKKNPHAHETPEPSAIDPLASPENAEAFGVAFGIGGTLAGAAALYAKAEDDDRRREREASKPHAAGRPPRGAKRAGER